MDGSGAELHPQQRQQLHDPQQQQQQHEQPPHIHWAIDLVAYAESPSPLSARDGRLLRLVGRDRRLDAATLASHLGAALASSGAAGGGDACGSLLLSDAIANAFSAAEAAAVPKAAAAAAVATAPAAAPATAAAKATKARAANRSRSFRHVAALLRGWAYLRAGDAAQAVSDARAALASAPPPSSPPLLPLLSSSPAAAAASSAEETAGAVAFEQETGGVSAAAASSTRMVAAASGNGGDDDDDDAGGDGGLPPPPLSGILASAWAPAHELAAASAAAAGDWTAAALHAQIALELQQAVNPRIAAALAARVAQYAARLPPAHAAALAACGARGLARRVARDAEDRLPVFMRPPRPSDGSWVHYNRWMRRRIAAVRPDLPPAVVKKLLAGVDAGELDARLAAAGATGGGGGGATASGGDGGRLFNALADELCEVLERDGPAALTAHAPTPLTSWDEARPAFLAALSGGGGGLSPGNALTHCN